MKLIGYLAVALCCIYTIGYFLVWLFFEGLHL